MNFIKIALLLPFLVISCSRQTNEQHSDEHANYHFQLKYKWGDKKWAIRKDLLMYSG